MSSLKDIMDVDVEPLESQAYRRSREAAQQQTSRPSIAPSSATPSPPIDDNIKGKAPIRRRRSNRVAKPVATHPTSSRPSITRRRSSAAGEAMDFSPGFRAGGSNQASTTGSPQQSSRGSEPAADMPVKYTPVTGRISRAKKGVPVHTCDICRPVKTFTRAEHLRRHQLSHQKPAYPCTFQDCERAFHRPDLLARHLHRHETQGEKAYKSGDPRSRASSSASESRTPPLKVETPSQGIAANQTSPTDSATPRTSASGESSMTASSFNTITTSFQAVNFSSGPSHKRSASQAQLSESEPYSSASPGAGPSRTPGGYDQLPSSFSTRPVSEMGDQTNFGRSAQPGFDELYSSEGGNPHFPSYTTTPQLPLLRIPEETYIPGLSYTQDNSPWCSSASDSTYSTQSDGSRNGRHWTHRARSASLTTVPDWSAAAAAAQWSPHGISTTPQDLRSPPFESIMEQFETPYTSPRMTPPSSSRQLLDVPNSFGGYYMESVGTPALSTYNKPLAQLFSASPTRISDPGLAGIDRRRSKELVGESQLALTAAATMTSSYQTQTQLDIYLSSYWQSFHKLFPIIHQATFDPIVDSLLTSAMAAIGTQYHDTSEARAKGSELNEACRKGIDLCLNWSLHTMQAILLTEIFTRFRGRKTTVRLSRHFEELYSRLLNASNQGLMTFSNPSPVNLASADALLDRFGAHTINQPLQHNDIQSEWARWVDTEARQRLLSSCFIFDVHQALYHEQSRSKVHLDEASSLLWLPCPESLWNALTASEWQALKSDYSIQPLHLMEQDISSQSTINNSPFTQSLLICSLATRLPTREDPTYPNDFLPHSTHPNVAALNEQFSNSPLAHTYLALHYTPLYDLLAIAGDTWVFAQKITPPSKFHSAQSRLKTWSSSLAAAAATQHACRILSSTLSQPASGTACLSDYWSLYTAALICWAFGNRYQTSGSGSGTLSRNNSSTAINDAMDCDDSPVHSIDDASLKAVTYANRMLELSVEDLLTCKPSIRGDTSGVIDAVRTRLEMDGTVSRSSLLVDAIGVLGRIKEGKGKWF